MGMYWNRHLLRNDYAFDNIIEEVVRGKAIAIRNEPAITIDHDIRLAMADRVISGRDDVVASFLREIKDRAVREQAFLDAAFANAKADATGAIFPRSQDIPDPMLDAGVEKVWVSATLSAWPTIRDDIAPTPADPVT